MKQGKISTRERARRAGEKEVLELQKTRHMIYDLLRRVRQKKEYHPELYSILDLEHVWADLRDIGMHTDCALEHARGICDLLRDGHRAVYSTEVWPACSYGERDLPVVAEKEGSYPSRN